MNIDDIKKLRPGQTVVWVDPDMDEDCTRVVEIKTIRVNGEVVTVEDRDGSVVECLPDELKQIF